MTQLQRMKMVTKMCGLVSLRLSKKQIQPFIIQWSRRYSSSTKTAKHDTPLLVSCDWLKQQKDDTNNKISLLDVTYFRNQDEKGRQVYNEKHLPGAVFVDMFEGAQHTDLIVMNVPALSLFEDTLQRAGVNQDSHVVVYDSEGRNGFYAASRALWQIKLYGKDTASLLNGGLQKWEALGYPVTAEIPAVQRGDFRATYNPSLQASYEDVQRSLGKVQIIDARPRSVFKEVSIKGSVSVPFSDYFRDGMLKPREELKKMFEDQGVDLSAPAVATCMVGMSACALSVALNYVGLKDVSVYTGSMTEWRQRAAPEQMNSR